MAALRDGTPPTGSVNGGDSFTITLSTTGTNRLILVGIGNSNATVTGVTPTATGLTFAQVGTTQTSQTGSAQLWRAFASAQLTSTVITCTADVLSQFPQMTGWAVGYSGTNTSGTNGSGAIDVTAGTSSAGSNGLSQAVTTTTDNDLVIALADLNNTTAVTAGAGQTVALQFANPGGFNKVALIESNAITSPAGSATMSYTLGGASIPDAIVVAAIKPAAAATPHNLTTMGIGN